MRQVFVTQITNLQNFTQIQKEAAIDLLLLVMYADGIISPDETEYIDRLLLDSTWAGNEDLEDYLAGSRVDVIELLREDHDKLIKFVEHARLRIGDAEKIKSIYSICATMANADNKIHPKELEILKLLMDTLA